MKPEKIRARVLLVAAAIVIAGVAFRLMSGGADAPAPAEVEASASPPMSAPEPMLQLSDHARAMARVETAPALRRPLVREIRAVGKVQYNEAGLATITARVEGYVEKLYVDFTGVEVKAGDHLVELYSPDLVVAQQELLIALSDPRSAALATSARLKLLRWGLTEAQVQELVDQRKPRERLALFSPIRGTVTEKLVVQNSMVKPGDVLYRLANLESVWVYLDLYESELAAVQYGQDAEISAEAYPGRTFSGRVWFINPVLSEESRTVKVLINISNRERKLKPGMYVSAVLRAPLLASGEAAPTAAAGQFSCPMHPEVLQREAGRCPICGMQLARIPGEPGAPISEDEQLVLAVPVTAVLDSGVRKLVYVERSPGAFTPVQITAGPRAGEFFPVLSGLEPGDFVAVRGNFLLDSQFQISGLPSLFFREGQAPAVGHQHGGAAAQPDAGGGSSGHAGHPMSPTQTGR